MLTRLRLKNFKKHQELDLSFTDGLNLVTGPNYTGKSTILHAVLYALGGPRAVPGGKAVVTTKGEKSTTVDLDFLIEGDSYRVQRKGTTASIWKNDELIAKSASAVNAHLEELLGLEMKRFLQLRYGEQKATEALLTLGAAELHKIIQEVSEVDVVERAIAGCSSIANTAKAQLQVLPEEDTEAMGADLETMAKALRTEYETLQADKKKMDEYVQAESEARERLAEANAYNLKIAATTERRRALAEDLATLDEEIEAFAQPLGEPTAEEIRSGIASYEAAGEEWVRQRMEAEVHIARLANLAGEVSTLEVRLDETSKLLSRAQEDLLAHPIPKDLDAESTILAELRAAEQGVTTRLEEAISARTNSVCPTCKRPYEDDPLHLEELDRRIQSLTKERDDLARSIAAQHAVVEEGRALTQSLQKLQQIVDRHTTTVAHQRSDLEAARAKHADLLQESWGEKYEIAKREAEGFQRLAAQWQAQLETVIEAETKLNGLRERRERVSEALDALSDEPTIAVNIEPLEQVLAGVRQLTQNITSEVYRNEAEYRGAYQDYTHLKERHQKAQEGAEQRRQIEHRQGVATKLNKYLKGNRDRFVAEIWDGILGYASSFASNSTDGAIGGIRRTESGAFAYTENEAEYPIEAASGAQKSIMGLGVQLALGQMLPSALPVLLLDEPSADFDAEHSLTVASLLSSEPNQLIMVSHRELDGAVASNTIHLER